MSYNLEFNAMWFLRKSQNRWAKTFDSSEDQGVIGLSSGLYEFSHLGVKKRRQRKDNHIFHFLIVRKLE